jgi:hypothetical protein
MAMAPTAIEHKHIIVILGSSLVPIGLRVVSDLIVCIVALIQVLWKGLPHGGKF